MMMGTLARNVETTPPAPGAPGMFRCAAEGQIAQVFMNAGLKNIYEVETDSKFTGTADDYWGMMTEVAAPVVAALKNADDATKAKIKREIYEQLQQQFPSGQIAIPGNARIIYAEK